MLKIEYSMNQKTERQHFEENPLINNGGILDVRDGQLSEFMTRFLLLEPHELSISTARLDQFIELAIETGIEVNLIILALGLRLDKTWDQFTFVARYFQDKYPDHSDCVPNVWGIMSLQYLRSPTITSAMQKQITEETVIYLENALQKNPNDLGILNDLLEICFEYPLCESRFGEDLKSKALWSVTSIIEISEDEPDYNFWAHSMKGNMLFHWGRWSEALEEFNLLSSQLCECGESAIPGLSLKTEICKFKGKMRS